MQELKCPNCGKVFQVDEAGYAQIVQQVRGEEFDRELRGREAALKDQHQKDLKMAQADREQALIQARAQNAQALAEKDRLITQLHEQLKQSGTEKELAVTQAVTEKDQERTDALSKKEAELAERDKRIAQLESQLKQSGTERTLAVTQAESKKDQERSDAIAKKDAQLAEQEKRILELESQLKNSGSEKELAVTQAKNAAEQAQKEQELEIIRLKGRLSNEQSESQLKEKALKEQYEAQLKAKDEQIEYYKDFKARQSTKMVGESLEQHCQNQFNQLRMTAFPNAYFEKDNDARTGSKGDFIFRESEDGTEFISIMFEMKNEMEETATKHRNEDFFKELDKDRREKGCEYAVLVSLLEADNDFYNSGIVDVSYRYEKMYVVRPQFFIPIITLLRNAARNSLKYQRQLREVRNQQIDVENFEDAMNDFKDKFGRNYRLASEKFKTAIDEIDKSIQHLQKIKDNLLGSENNLRLANQKAEDLTIKRLTKNAPSVRAMFEEQRQTRLGQEEAP